MIKFADKFSNRISGDKVKESKDFLNSLDWNLFLKKHNDEWEIITGDQHLCSFSTEDEMNAFIIGMALGLSVLPEKIIEDIKKAIDMEE